MMHSAAAIAYFKVSSHYSLAKTKENDKHCPDMIARDLHECEIRCLM
jgi:hypothetical protein